MNLLYLAHRLPFPPDKGDKVRSFHLLRHLTARHRVFVGTFIDDPDDEPHVDTLRAMCAGLYVARLRRMSARLRSLRGLPRHEALTVGYYRDEGLARWVADTVATQGITKAVVFSSSMAQYVAQRDDVEALVDFVDVDSAKWAQYADLHGWPLSWLYRREARRLLDYERATAQRARRSFFVTDAEVALFQRLTQGSPGSVLAMGNGVDDDYFSPADARLSPFAPDERPIVFTGAMDYLPNIDAVRWFVDSVLPRVRSTWPSVRFHVVGRHPPASVTGLAGEAVTVAGGVPDVRPYLQHAAVVVAPMRIARGVQNKILEAMAMARPVVAAQACVDVLDVAPGTEVIGATGPEDFARAIRLLLDDPLRAAAIGAAGRRRVCRDYAWSSRLAAIDADLGAMHEALT